MTVYMYIVAKGTPLIILLVTVLLLKKFSHEVVNWFNSTNKTHFNPSIQEKLFGVTSEQFGKNAMKKFNYTLLFMKYYIYTNKLHTSSILLADFVNKISLKYRIEHFEV